jgi:formylglycine-generating enzyme required for sulfatase activity/tRNA A-37 threonylcarbamoyl transferase component Bud32/predicted  nucleic acid-binding Zn-ribbon protein
MANDEQPSAHDNTENTPQDSGANGVENIEAWSGNEQTLVGVPSHNKEGNDPLQVVVPEGNSSAWLGSEQTMLPASSSDGGDGGESWTGTEQTLVGGITPGAATRKPVTEVDRQWLGNDATIIGTPSPQGKATGDKGATTAGGGRKTHSTMDDGWHLKGRQGPLTGQTIGDYEIGGILGEGGMGTVYRAKQISLKRRVALKVLPPNLASNAQLRQRFEQEATTASLLNSPHVVQVFAAGSHNDLVYFVMEFVEGTDLAEKIREKNDAVQLFTPDEAANFVVQAARGLAEASKHNIVHRDIKPANLMITAKGVVKIADFGISKIAGEHGLTMTGTAVGTPAYCSPEQGRGDKVDARADIYSLGVVFYELLTGRKPFDGATANALIYQHNYAEPTLITALRAEVPDAYQAVALKCLQKDPAKRYQDAAELVADIERVRAGSAPMTALMNAFGTGADEAMRRLGIKQRKMWPYVVAALLLVSLVGGVVVWQMQRTAQQQNMAFDVDRLRKSLSQLDNAQPIKQGVRDELNQLSDMVGEDDADVSRWNKKLSRVEELQKSLAVLDTAEYVAYAQRGQITTDLTRYRDDVGSSGEDIVRWQKKVDATQNIIAQLRTTLGELDQASVITVSSVERLGPALDQLVVLAGEQDDDVKRWQLRIGATKDRVGGLRAKLAKLDKSDAIIKEAELALLEQDALALKAMVGEQDAGAQKAQQSINERRELLASLRKNLARLDGVTWVTTTLQAALSGDLQRFTTLVDENDPDLKRWLSRISEANARIGNFRAKLARLDQPEVLSASEQTLAEEHLTAYRALVSPDDGQLQAWDARLRAERDAVATLMAVLKRFDDKAKMTVVELDATSKAITSLFKIKAIPEAKYRSWEQRINEERQALAAMRQSLRARDEAGVAIDQQLVDDLNHFAALVGQTDQDVARWRARVSTYEKLYAVLVLLNEPHSLPDGVEEALEQFSKIVGPAAADVRRWREKITRVHGIQKKLAPLDAVVSLPEQAVQLVAELRKDVGDKDPQWQKWHEKVQRVDGLTNELREQLKNAYILPAAAPRVLKQLTALVGSEDEDVSAFTTRVAILAGPGRPAWASSVGRDDFGLWAELTVKGATQRFRYVPAGTFILGSEEKEKGRETDETSVRITLTKSFWLADTETTQQFWTAIWGSHNSRFTGLELPVERISWDDAKAFCAKLATDIPTMRVRLPTEAEWEYACRAGQTAPFTSHMGPVADNKLDTIAWFADNAKTTQGVKRKFGNALALFDMHGNVWEWCEDRYGVYSPTPTSDPVGREQETRVARGGSWGDRPDRLRAANRLAVRPDMRTLYLGVRMAVNVDWPEGKDPTAEQAFNNALQSSVKRP